MTKPGSRSTREFDAQGFARGIHELLILAALREGPRHGYQIALDVEAHSNGVFRFRHGTLYPILHRMDVNGLILGRWSSGSGSQEEGLFPDGCRPQASQRTNRPGSGDPVRAHANAAPCAGTPGVNAEVPPRELPSRPPEIGAREASRPEAIPGDAAQAGSGSDGPHAGPPQDPARTRVRPRGALG